MDDIRRLRLRAAQCRRLLTDMIYRAGTGHIGGSLSCADILVALYFSEMRTDPQNPGWEGRDRFILSKGHSVEAYYAALALKGFFPEEELATFSQPGSPFIGHPSTKVPGVDFSTGALGHGLPVAVGLALAFVRDGRPNRVFTVMGDGEQAEGSVWEAAMAAANHKLGNLYAVLDRNRLQISGCTEDVMRLGDLQAKYEAFGWQVVAVDGHDFAALLDAFAKAAQTPGKPHLLLASTVKGKGVSFMENNAKWHHGVLTDEQYAQAVRELDQTLAEVQAQ